MNWRDWSFRRRGCIRPNAWAKRNRMYEMSWIFTGESVQKLKPERTEATVGAGETCGLPFGQDDFLPVKFPIDRCGMIEDKDVRFSGSFPTAVDGERIWRRERYWKNCSGGEITVSEAEGHLRRQPL